MSSPNKIAEGQFSGTGTAFFKIYCVNILLTIITLGLYTPWARVRTKRYLYGNLHLGKYSFDYHADPNKIFKVFVIIYTIIIAITMTFFLAPDIFLIIMAVYLVGLFVAAPWITNRSLAFNARMTSFANIRFSFKGSYWGSFAILYLLPLLSAISLGFAAPYIHKKFKEYFLSKHSWGKMHLGSHIPTSKVYMVFLLCYFMPVFLLVIAYFAGLGVAMSGEIHPLALLSNGTVMLCIFLLMLMVPLGVLYYFTFIQVTLIKNIHASFADHETETAEERLAHYKSLQYQQYKEDTEGRFLYFRSTQGIFKTSLKIIGNAILVSLTGGMFTPFAIVNLLKYTASCVTLCGNPDLIAQNQSAVTEQGGYAMDEIASATDLDLAI